MMTNQEMNRALDKHNQEKVYVDKTGTDQKLNPLRDVYQEFPLAMYAVAALTAFGAGKHPVRGWRTFDHVYALGYHLGKIGRHLLDLETEGEVNEADGDMLHMAQVAWNALGYLDHLLRQRPELLDRIMNPVLVGSTHTDKDGITTTIIDAMPSLLPSGTMMLFQQKEPPAGWSKVDGYAVGNNVMARKD